MWIIPKNLHTLASVQDTEALTLDSQELSEMYAQSLLARSKPSPVKTWSRRLKQDTLTLLPYGRTLKPSHGKAFEDEWTSYQEASLVSHLAPQEDEQETATLDTCGPTSPKVSENWGDLPLFSSRTSKASSAPNSKDQSGQTQRGHLFCSMSSENWKDWVTQRRREYSQRAKSALPINANECSFWVVAPISAPQGEGLLMGCSETQSEGNLWATIRVGASKAPAGGGDPSKEDHPYRIENQVQVTQSKNWPTPNTSDAFDPNLPHDIGRNYLRSEVVLIPPPEEQSSTPGNPQGSQWATPYTGTKDHQGGSLEHYQRRMEIGKQICVHGQVTLDAQAYKGKLNPRWVETLMGLPVGWTMPSCANPWTIEQTSSDCLEMELSQPQQSEPSESSGQALEEVLKNRDAYPWVDDD